MSTERHRLPTFLSCLLPEYCSKKTCGLLPGLLTDCVGPDLDQAAACPWAPGSEAGEAGEAEEELRLDPTDGGWFTELEFLAFYGGTAEWVAAATAMAAMPRCVALPLQCGS